MKKLDKDQVEHIGLVLEQSKYGFHLDRSWYGKTRNKPSVGGVPDKYLNDAGTHYNDEYFEENLPRVLLNYDLNMKHYESLDRELFERTLTDIVNGKYNFRDNSYSFEECVDITSYPDNMGCVYLMVLGKYKQIYIGQTSNFAQRVRSHWIGNKPFDRLIFGRVENSVLSFDSFRAFDTTEIFVIPNLRVDAQYELESIIVDKLPAAFNANRTSGGLLDGGLNEAIANRKTRDLE